MTRTLSLFILVSTMVVLVLRYVRWSSPTPLDDNARLIESMKRVSMVALVLAWIACLALLCAEIRGG